MLEEMKRIFEEIGMPTDFEPEMISEFVDKCQKIKRGMLTYAVNRHTMFKEQDPNQYFKIYDWKEQLKADALKKQTGEVQGDCMDCAIAWFPEFKKEHPDAVIRYWKFGHTTRTGNVNPKHAKNGSIGGCYHVGIEFTIDGKWYIANRQNGKEWVQKVKLFKKEWEKLFGKVQNHGNFEGSCHDQKLLANWTDDNTRKARRGPAH